MYVCTHLLEIMFLYLQICYTITESCNESNNTTLANIHLALTPQNEKKTLQIYRQDDSS